MQKGVWRMTNSAPDRVLINDPKKLFRKKLYVTIPQWSETFPSRSDLSSDHNSAKCGLALNDPIDWFKLRLNQPKRLFTRFDFSHSLMNNLYVIAERITHFFHFIIDKRNYQFPGFDGQFQAKLKIILHQGYVRLKLHKCILISLFKCFCNRYATCKFRELETFVTLRIFQSTKGTDGGCPHTTITWMASHHSVFLRNGIFALMVFILKPKCTAVLVDGFILMKLKVIRSFQLQIWRNSHWWSFPPKIVLNIWVSVRNVRILFRFEEWLEM